MQHNSVTFTHFYCFSVSTDYCFNSWGFGKLQWIWKVESNPCSTLGYSVSSRPQYGRRNLFKSVKFPGVTLLTTHSYCVKVTPSFCMEETCQVNYLDNDQPISAGFMLFRKILIIQHPSPLSITECSTGQWHTNDHQIYGLLMAATERKTSMTEKIITQV